MVQQSNLPLMIFLHGFLGDSQDFTIFCEAFSNRYQCISLNWIELMHLEDALTFEKACKKLSLLPSQYDKTSMTIIGYSMGGRVAMTLKQFYPECIDKLVILGAHPGLQEEEKKMREPHEKHWLHLLQTLPQDHFLNEWYTQSIFHTLKDKPKLYKALLERKGTYNQEMMIQAFSQLSLRHQPSCWNVLDQNTLILVGDLDMTYKALFQAFFTRCNSSKTVTIPDSSHALLVEAPYVCVEKISDFLT